MSGIVGRIGAKSGIVTVPDNQILSFNRARELGDKRYDPWKHNPKDLIVYWKADHVTNSAGNLSSDTIVTGGFVYDAPGSTVLRVKHGNVTNTTGKSYTHNGKCLTMAGGMLWVELSGVSNYNTYINHPSSFTQMAWIDWDGSSRQGWCSRYDGAGVAHWNHMLDSRTQMHHNASGVGLGSGDRTGNNFSSSAPSDWNMFVVTYDVVTGHTIRYIDGYVWHWENPGVNSGHGHRGPSTNGTYHNNTTAVAFCGRNDGAEKMSGHIAEFGLWKRCITQQEVKTLWDATKGKYGRSDQLDIN